jgi:hypothetical protein
MGTIEIAPGWGAPVALQVALDKAGPGDIIELQPGEHRFSEPAVLRIRNGTPRDPIVVRAKRGAIVRGHAGPLPLAEWRMPGAQEWAFLQIMSCQHVVVEDMYFADCWPVAVYAERSSGLTFRDCIGLGGSFLFVVRDQPPYGQVRDIAVERCRWVQDPRIWASLPWRRIHDNGELHNYLNGGMFGVGDIVGDVRFTHNLVSDCYNGLVADISPEFRRLYADLKRTNRNFEVAHNIFERVRDNPIEPEWHAFNWHIHHNAFVDCHSWFSFDHVAGGWWYVYANTGWFRSRPGGGIGDDHSGGEVFKMTNALEPANFGRVYVFNNSFRLRAPMFGNANDDQPNPTDRYYEFLRWSVLDNAVEWCDARDAGVRPLCDAPIEAFEPGARFPDAIFDRTLTSNPSWQEFLAENAHAEASPRTVAGGIFRGGSKFDFRLTPAAEAQARAQPFDILYPDGTRLRMDAPRLIGAKQTEGVSWPVYRPF